MEFVFEVFNVVLFALDVDIVHKEKDHLIRKVLDPLTYKLYAEIATENLENKVHVDSFIVNVLSLLGCEIAMLG